MVIATPVAPFAEPELTTGGTAVIVNVTVLLPVPPALVAVTVALYVPGVVGMPVIAPVMGFTTLRPGGKPVAPYVVEQMVLVAVMV